MDEMLERADDTARADVAGARKISPQRDEAKIRIEANRAQLASDKGSLARSIDEKPACHASAILALDVQQPNLCALAPVFDETLRHDAFEDLHAVFEFDGLRSYQPFKDFLRPKR